MTNFFDSDIIFCEIDHLLNIDVDATRFNHNEIISNLSEEHQQLFTKFALIDKKYGKKEFDIDILRVWKWIGYARIEYAKNAVFKHLKENKDFVKEIKNDKEHILLSTNAFKRFCLFSGTEKSIFIQKYYVALENSIIKIKFNAT